jgi:adenosine deaminase
VRYAEIRCSPANYADSARGRSPWVVLSDIKAALDAARNSAAHAHSRDPSSPPPCRVNLLLIGTRQAKGDYRAGIARHLALAVTAAEHWTSESECRVVGVDLAGYEDKETRAHYFREEFTGVHRCGLALTVHAGENDDAEGIWRAVFDLNARRLGHALSLAQSPELLRSVTDRGIGLEMCPYANLQIRGFALDETAHREVAPRRYPLLDYLRAGARVTVNTDNIGISAATLTDNLLLAARLCPGLIRLDLLRLQRNALDSAFVPAGQRTELVRQFAAHIRRL